MALTKAQRAERAARVLGELRPLVWRRPRRRVELELQAGRRRPKVSGVVAYVASSGAFVMLAGDDWPEGAPATILAEPRSAPPSLHVPVDVIRSVRTL